MGYEVIESYLIDKGALYSQFSRFACEDGCPRYGCKSDLAVSASLMELYGQALFLRRSMLEVFHLAYRLSPFVEEGLDRVRIRITLKKPCIFLENGKLCSIYPARPAVCALFPEFLALIPEKERMEYIGDNGIGAYPCVRQDSYRLTRQRAEAVRRLQRIHEKEIFGTEVYLFGLAGFSVDLREEMLGLYPEPTAGKVPYGSIEKALERFLSRTGTYAKVLDKLAAFEISGQAEGFLSTLSICEAIMEARS